MDKGEGPKDQACQKIVADGGHQVEPLAKSAADISLPAAGSETPSVNR